LIRLKAASVADLSTRHITTAKSFGSSYLNFLRRPAPQEPPATNPPNSKSEPFAFADFTWLNGNARTKDTPYATKFFTPEIRTDVNYTYDFSASSRRHH